MEPLNEAWNNLTEALKPDRRSPSKSRERRLAEVAWIVAIEMEERIEYGKDVADEIIKDWANMLHSAIQELRK